MLVETHSLAKHYGSITALDDCSLGVERGEVFGLLGPNGAGKTTLLRLLLGYLRPTRGRASIDGLDCQRQSVAVRRAVSYLPGDPRMSRMMRGRDVLRFFAEIRPGGDYQRSTAIADRLQLDTSRLVAFMSTGMRQKLAFAVAVAADTPLLILDEPTSNLDPSVRQTVSSLVLEAKKKGRTVLFSSHVLSEVEEVCDRVAILKAGKVALTQTIRELRRKHRLRATLNGELPEPPENLRDAMSVEQSGEQVVIEADDLPPLLGWLATVPVVEVNVEPVGLRAVYEQFHGERGKPR